MLGGGEYAIGTVQDVADIAPTTAKFSVAYVLSYQWFGSARHLYWDWTAKGFNNNVMYQGALIMFGVTAVVSAALAQWALVVCCSGCERSSIHRRLRSGRWPV